GEANLIRTLGDYSKPSHEGYKNTIELPEGNNVVPLRSDTIRESLSEAWTRFKDLLQKAPHHSIDHWLQIQIFYDHVSFNLKCEIDRTVGDKLCDKNTYKSWKIIKNLALYDHERWNDLKDFNKPVKAISTFQGTLKMPDQRLLKLEDQINFLLKGSRPTSRPSSTYVRNYTPYPQHQALRTTFDAHVRDYMTSHTERMERFEKAIFKQREVINNRMTEMIELLKELSASQTLEKMTTLAEHIIVAGAENRPPMLEKSMYDSWASRIRLFIKEKKHGRMMLDLVDNGLLVYPTIEENRQTRPKKYSKLTKAQQLQDDCDVQATNIILHGLPPDVYVLVNHQKAAKDIWDIVKMLMKGTELSYQERECRLYNLFDKFAHVSDETLINDMHTIGMTMQQVQVNTKFLNALLLEWSKFITDVKLAKSLYTTNYDQLYAYLSQHEQNGNEVRITHERCPDSLAFQREDPIECINKAMPFLSAVASRLRNAAWFKEKLMLAEAQEASLILDEEKLAFLVDLDCDDLSLAKVVLMANLLSYDPEVLFEAPYSKSYLNDMIN
nr:retrovirus-related Pol polyprotein from transposon TNT 1-94 [Tanacetum cinerariifolium]